MTNEVSWTIPEGGVIALPMSAEQAEAREKEVELVMESYPYPATIAAEYTKAGKHIWGYVFLIWGCITIGGL